MARKLHGRRIAFLVTDGFEQIELTRPWDDIEAQGGIPELVSLRRGKVQGMQHFDKGDMFSVDTTVDKATANEYDGLVLPGGVHNPDTLRLNIYAVRFVRDFFEKTKPVAAICHGPWMLIEADVLKGRTVTSWPSLKTDIKNAGGHWVDKEVCVDNGLITSRKPGDLNAFCSRIIEAFGEAPYLKRAV